MSQENTQWSGGYQPNPASATVSIGRDFRKRQAWRRHPVFISGVNVFTLKCRQSLDGLTGFLLG